MCISEFESIEGFRNQMRSIRIAYAKLEVHDCDRMPVPVVEIIPPPVVPVPPPVVPVPPVASPAIQKVPLPPAQVEPAIKVATRIDEQASLGRAAIATRGLNIGPC